MFVRPAFPYCRFGSGEPLIQRHPGGSEKPFVAPRESAAGKSGRGARTDAARGAVMIGARAASFGGVGLARCCIALLFFFIAGIAMAQEPSDRNGHYVPENDIILGDYRIDWFELQTVSYEREDGPDYRQPKRIRPKAVLVVTHVPDQKQYRYRFQNPRVTGETVFLAFAFTPVGIVAVQGEFLDERGTYWNQPDIIELKTPVFRGTVSAVKIGRQTAVRTSLFLYWDGR